MNGWTALADPTRRSIFGLVAARPHAVGEIARELPVTRPAVSQHLKLLKTARLVVDEAQGTRRVYRVDPAGLGEGPRVRAARTRVELEHRNLDRHGDGWQGLGEGVGGGHGWPLYLQRFAVAVAAT